MQNSALRRRTTKEAGIIDAIVSVIKIGYTDQITNTARPIAITDPQQASHRVHVFCDGTTYFGTNPQIAIAGYAIVEAEPHTEEYS